MNNNEKQTPLLDQNGQNYHNNQNQFQADLNHANHDQQNGQYPNLDDSNKQFAPNLQNAQNNQFPPQQNIQYPPQQNIQYPQQQNIPFPPQPNNHNQFGPVLVDPLNPNQPFNNMPRPINPNPNMTFINPIPQQNSDVMDEAEFKIKGVIELQKEFGAEEVVIVKKQKHFCSLFLNLILLGSYIFIIVTLIQGSTNRYTPTMRFLEDYFWIFIVVYLVYLIEFCCSNTLSYLWNKKDSGSIYNYVNQIKNTKPSISMTCECYHFETRIRYVTESYTVQGTNGPETRTRQRMETYQQKVVTHSETEQFDFQRFYEISRMISDDIYNNDLIKIKFGKKIEFGDPFTRNRYDLQLTEFVRRNKNRDSCFSYSEYKEIPGYKERMFSVNGEKHSCLINWPCYTLITFFGFSWFYRIWVEAKCVRGSYNFQMIVFRENRGFY